MTTWIGSVTLPNPVMTASGTAGHGAELGAYFDLSALGAVVVKSLKAEPWPGNPPLRVVLICDERANQQVGNNYRKRVITISRTGRAEVLKEAAAVNSLGDPDLLTCPTT